MPWATCTSSTCESCLRGDTKSRLGEETGLVGRLAGLVAQCSSYLTAKNSKKELLDCVYLKQRLHCVLFCDDGRYGNGAGGQGANRVEGDKGRRRDNDGGGSGAGGREGDLEGDAV
jgi:hypothetical protein